MSTAAGRVAENLAADYLAKRGYTIVAKNWRTRWCEIDIVAVKSEVTYLVEVKYRAQDTWGSGFDYITHHKLQHMQLAARFWQATHKTGDYRLSAIQLTGQPPQVTEWLASID